MILSSIRAILKIDARHRTQQTIRLQRVKLSESKLKLVCD